MQLKCIKNICIVQCIIFIWHIECLQSRSIYRSSGDSNEIEQFFYSREQKPKRIHFAGQEFYSSHDPCIIKQYQDDDADIPCQKYTETENYFTQPPPVMNH